MSSARGACSAPSSSPRPEASLVPVARAFELLAPHLHSHNGENRREDRRDHGPDAETVASHLQEEGKSEQTRGDEVEDRLPPPFHHNFSVSSGTSLNRSPTSPRSATWKIGASSSLLIATMSFESFMPARCWIAPDMPIAI